jgi:transcriptional regulator with XRE-family HTH domain
MYFATLNNELHIIILCFATVDQEVIYRDDLVRTNLGDFGDCVEVEHPRTKSAAGDVPPEPTRQSYKLQSNSNLPSTGPSGQDSTGPSGQDPSTGPSGQDPSTGPSRQDLRKKTSLRRKYEAEKQSLEKQLGSLEDIRARLGLSQRKMAQLLMVDPSAWTRWIKEPSKVPPHVYRSLQWYLELTEKRPQWSPENSFGPLTQKLNQKIDETFSGDQGRLQQELAALRHEQEVRSRQIAALQESLDEKTQSFAEKVDNKDTALAIWKLFILLNSIILFFWLVWNLL